MCIKPGWQQCRLSLKLKNRLKSTAEASCAEILKVYSIPSRSGAPMYKVDFKCRCGVTFTRGLYNITKLLCDECWIVERSMADQSFGGYRRTVKFSEIKEWFESYGSELLTELKPCINANTVLRFRCKCGCEGGTKYGRMATSKPICRRCKAPKGSDSKLWKGGYDATSVSRNRLSKEEKLWARLVKRRYGNRCCITGRMTNLTAHHLDAVASNFEKRLDVANGVCISRIIHLEFHLLYDRFQGKCTRSQFSEFFFNKTGRKFEDYERTLTNASCFSFETGK